MDLKDKRIVLTGAAGGIGRAVASAALAAGARVVLCERNGELAEAALESCAGVGGGATASLVGDLTDEQAVKNMVAEAARELGGIDGVVNNAAIVLAQDTSAIDTPLAAWNETLAVNLSGAFLMCKYALPHLLEAKGGSIVNVSSVVAHAASAIPQIAYTTSKGGLEAMTREIAMTHARDNIRANTIAAGPVLTERTAHYFDTPEKWQTRRRHIPAGRLGKPQEIAALVCFLLSDDAAFQTGSTVFADGGIAAAYIIDDRDGAPKP